MLEPVSNRNPLRPPKGPDFLLVVALSGIVLLVCFVGAWLLVRTTGRELLPAKSHDYEPHAALRLTNPPLNPLSNLQTEA